MTTRRIVGKMYNILVIKGTLPTLVGNQTEFCRNRGIHQGNFNKMVRGERLSCQGWRLYNEGV